MILLSLEQNRDEELSLDNSRKPPRVKRIRPGEKFLILSNGQKSIKFKNLDFSAKMKMCIFAVKTIFGLESPL